MPSTFTAKTKTGGKNSQPKVSLISELKIDLVKALELNMSLRESATLSVLNKLISLEAVDHSDIDDVRWWHIDARMLAACDTHNLFCGHPATAADYLNALERKGLIEQHELDHVGGARQVLRFKPVVILD